MARLDELFDIQYPKTLIFSNQVEDEKGIPFVSSKGTNNGIVSKVAINGKSKIYPKGCITVALKGSVLSTFLQFNDCYVAHQIAVLTPKSNMSDREKIFYCLCIKENKYRYNYGRQADNTLKGIVVPSKEEIPSWVYEMELPKYEVINGRHTEEPTPSLDVEKWGSFKYSDLFDISVGTTLSKDVEEGGTTPYISASGQNNGVLSYVKSGGKKLEGGAITVPIVGNSVAIAGYQENEFVLSNNAIALRLKNKDLNNYIALFLITIIRMESYRYGYGRKWGLNRMVDSIIKLPITKEGTPDWEFMEKYIKTLKYSKEL